MNLHDIRVMEGSNKLRFTLETCDEVRVFLQIRVENFNGDVTLQQRIASLPDLCHPTLSQTLQKLVFPKTLRVCTHNGLLILAQTWSLVPTRRRDERTCTP